MKHFSWNDMSLAHSQDTSLAHSQDTSLAHSQDTSLAHSQGHHSWNYVSLAHTQGRVSPLQHRASPGPQLPPLSGAVLSAHDVCYRVSVGGFNGRQKMDKDILSHVTAVFKPGLSAVMGPTGSGKSTFLDILASRKDSSHVTGQILLDGKAVPSNYKCLVGYVVQEDTVMGTLTVRENLEFSAALRLPTSINWAEKRERVDKVIKELGLESCADTKVGNQFFRGVSGGERKRCNIGMELIISPPVLFLDEPTTGLDANTAKTVLTYLKRLSRRGRTIILSIHQPRYSIFSLFDQLLLLSQGHVVYNGPAQEALDFFASQGFKCHIYNNPADFFLDVMMDQENRSKTLSNTGNNKKPREEYNMTNNLLFCAFRRSPWCMREEVEAGAILQQFQSLAGDRGSRHKPVSYSTSFPHQIVVVAGRTIKNTLRNPFTHIVTLGASLVLAALISAIYWQLSLDPSTAFKDRVGVSFFLIINQLFFNLASMDIFLHERKIFTHENVSGFYRVSVYFLVKVVCDIIPLRLIPIILMSSIVYFCLGLNPGADNFLLFMFTLFCTTLSTAGLCFLVGASVREFATAQALLALTCILMMLFGGFLVSFKSIGPWFNWVQYLSFFKYALAALYIIEFKDREFCTSNSTFCKSGNSFLMEQEVDFQEPWDFWRNHFALLMVATGFLLLTYVQLRRLKKIL